MNNMVSVHITKLDKDLPLPSYAKPGDAGMDLYASLIRPLTIYPNGRALVPTGIAIALPDGYEAQVRPRSGLAAKHGLTVLNAPGTVDSSYRGEIKAVLINHSNVSFTINHGDRIAQMIVAPVSYVEWNEVEQLAETERSSAGFGSTGL